MIIQVKWLDIDLTIPKEIRKQVLKNLVRNIKCLKKNCIWAFEIQLKYVKLKQILNTSCENRKKSLLNILLKGVFATNVVNKTAVIDDKINRILRY